ncbi:MAG: cob(I)yrinic acid a,c-diamide adenosyltransferase [Chloroflexi bacterium]|nr:cob(I)yrinic acid a,c-diamide adenosyltransferase [Chloroflexota bacterium]MCK4262563.1 cob(I)yrinic acid a,c-diamide adenosyltransferase [Dehalococcoidia bacterium]
MCERGLIQVYTGAGKGKTTAALGLALRAVGQGMKVIVIQFIKGDRSCGEHRFCARYRPFELVQLNPGDSFVQTREELRETTERTLAFAQKTVVSGQYDVVILDEILVAVSKGLVTSEEALELMGRKARKTELVLTGRGATKEIIEKADLVTEMVAIKHPFDSGITGRKGIEY